MNRMKAGTWVHLYVLSTWYICFENDLTFIHTDEEAEV